uniref:Putative secreted protein n=1 Tax=Panstrongylus lignarius TaxID=156445 RepID=A0A224Y1V5_9HEMI
MSSLNSLADLLLIIFGNVWSHRLFNERALDILRFLFLGGLLGGLITVPRGSGSLISQLVNFRALTGTSSLIGCESAHNCNGQFMNNDPIFGSFGL